MQKEYISPCVFAIPNETIKLQTALVKCLNIPILLFEGILLNHQNHIV